MFNLAALKTLNTVKTVSSHSIFVRTLKDEVKIKWNRPERIAKHSPQRTGDLGKYEAPDPTSICVQYQYADELNDAVPNVRNQFTLGWHDKVYTKQYYEKTLMDSVKSHVYDYDSEAAKIAQYTAAIRFYQNGFEEDTVHGRERRWNKYLIKRYSIDRMLILKNLRQNDYKQFEWILERMDLFFKPEPAPEDKIMIARKEGLRQLTRAHCDQVRQTKLDAYRTELEDQQLPFLEQKLKNLEFIRDEEIELNLERTITEEQINRVREQYEKLKIEVDAKKVAPTKKKWKIY